MKIFNQAIQKLEKNIDYYSYWLSNNSPYEFDDAKQELLIRIWKASSKYNSSISQVNTYFMNVIKNQAYRMLRNNKLQRNIMQLKTTSIYAILPNSEDNNKIVQVIDLVADKREKYDSIKKIEMNSLFDNIEKKLNGDANKIFYIMRNESLDLQTISKKLKMSKQNICNIIRRKIRPEMKKYFRL